jgi:DNA-binding LytR/AlgR family response regulator
LIRKLGPDLIFLDVEMPGLDAFQLLDGLQSGRAPEVIFVTAHDQYAVQAFNSSALHFLLKPIDDSQFEEAIRRARDEITENKAEAESADSEIGRADQGEAAVLVTVGNQRPRSFYLTQDGRRALDWSRDKLCRSARRYSDLSAANAN